jgi:arginine decarboxylase
MGYNVDFVDCGGGLGVDYDGTRSSSSESSVNYSIQEYVNDCIYTFVDASRQEQHRSSEHHHGERPLTGCPPAVLVIDVLETATLPEMPDEFEAKETDHQLVKDLYEIWDNLNRAYDARRLARRGADTRGSTRLCSHGIVDLKTRAEVESMYWSVCHEINSLAKS